ncbi:unnamed protein product [marine sediment metagenome]|uniref:Uncharacterized protein n=1 Tax=marine sediment metagenome TaxID=412755 RepID=X1HAF0_9ZZZZ
MNSKHCLRAYSEIPVGMSFDDIVFEFRSFGVKEIGYGIFDLVIGRSNANVNFGKGDVAAKKP